jgi:PAS domain-containing protein
MSSASAHLEPDREPWALLERVVEDLVKARSDLAAATEEAEAAGVELQRRTAEIDELNDVLEASFAVTDDVIVVVSAGPRRVRAWSAGAAQLFGLPAEEAIGRALGAMRVRGLPSSRLADEVARLARPAPTGIITDRSATVETPAGRFELTTSPAEAPSPVGAVVVRFVPRSGSDVHAGAEAADDAGQPA